MLEKFDSANTFNKSGQPGGGEVKSTGVSIKWQDDSLYKDDKEKKERKPNGTSVETLIDIARERLGFLQSVGGKYQSQENADAINDLTRALNRLQQRSLVVETLEKEEEKLRLAKEKEEKEMEEAEDRKKENQFKKTPQSNKESLDRENEEKRVSKENLNKESKEHQEHKGPEKGSQINRDKEGIKEDPKERI